MSASSTNGDPKRSEACSGTSSLSREKVQQLLAAMGTGPTDDTARVEAAEYNWHQPHYFSIAQLEKIEEFTRRAAAAMAEKFALVYHGHINVTVASTTQHFAEELLGQVSSGEQEDYYAVLGAGQEAPCGFISIPPQTAATWVAQLLGDSESEKDESKDLSQLEKSLLLDITSVIVEALSFSQSSYDFQSPEAIVRGQLPLELAGTEEFCKVSLSMEKTDAEKSEKMGEVQLLVLCEKLECVIGTTSRDTDGFSAEDVSKAILEHLQLMSVPVTAQLASAVVSFEQMLNIRAGDVLLLDKEVGKPVELVVEGLTILSGQPAKSAGKYAVAVTGYGEQT
ncbi:MAG: FliM/FliN family flagellar motor switch protein [Planctomycetota bacterium]